MNLIPTTVGITEILLILTAILFYKVARRSQPNSSTRKRADGDARLLPACSGQLDTVQYRLRDLKKATNYFADGNRLGKGGFGDVYKGLIDGKVVAIKLLKGSSVKLLADVAKEVSLLSSLNNDNLVKLLGFCSEAGRYLLVYEYISNGDLRGCLTDNKKRETLNWDKRFKIIEGIAEGLSYLHHNSENAVIHRDLKPENILLDEHYNPKIADFGLSSVFETEKTHKSTRKLAGTIMYIAPELWFQWQYSTKSDVYSYGLLVLEIIAGCVIPHYAYANQEALSHVMWKKWKDKRPLAEVIDSSLHENCAMDQIARCFLIGLICVQHDPKRRPDMTFVLEMLHNNKELPTPSIPGFFQEYASPQYSCSRTEFPRKDSARPEDSNTSELQPTDDARTEHSGSLESLVPKNYSLEELKVITDNFSGILHDRDFPTYKGLLDGQAVTVCEYPREEARRHFLLRPTVHTERKRKYKFFSSEKKMIKMNNLTLSRHPNIVKILGYCLEVEEIIIIIYDYPSNGLLYYYLSGGDLIRPQNLDWKTRVDIIKGVANGISYLHHGLQDKSLIHGDLKSSNIFLDDSWSAKLTCISTFSCMDGEYCFDMTTMRRTKFRENLAPECFLGRLPSDVFSYGMILLEILCGKNMFKINGTVCLILVVWKNWQQNEMLELLDPRLQNNCPEEEALRYFQIALLCIQREPEKRPSIQQVLEMFNSKDPLPIPSAWTSWFLEPR